MTRQPPLWGHDAIGHGPAIRAAKVRTMLPPDDHEIDCRECQGTGLGDGPDGPPCIFCDGSGIWT